MEKEDITRNNSYEKSGEWWNFINKSIYRTECGLSSPLTGTVVS